MKKLFLIAAAVVISTASFAQFSFGVHATGNLSNATFDNENDYDVDKKMKAMPGFGLVAQYRLNEKFSVRSGLTFLKHGAKVTGHIPADGDEPAVTAKTESDINYLQIPVNLLYTKQMSKVTLFAGGGVFFNYGLSGKIKIENSAISPDGTPYSFKEEIDAFKKASENGGDMKRTEFGLGALAGAQFNKVFANVGYQFGLSNLAGEEGKYKQQGLQLTIGYIF